MMIVGNIDGVLLTPLNVINTFGGNVLHGMKVKDSGYSGFGEAYFSFIKKGKIKAWKLHTEMTMNLVVPVGEVGFVFYFEPSSSFEVFKIGTNNYKRLTVPPNIWFGFKCLSPHKSYILNISNQLHDPKEVVRKPLSFLDFPS